MNVAYNIDCMEYMKTLPDKAFDLAVVDPPYGINVGSRPEGVTKSPLVKVGGGQLSRPKAIRHSMIAPYRMSDISKNWSEYQSIESFSAAITF